MSLPFTKVSISLGHRGVRMADDISDDVQIDSRIDYLCIESYDAGRECARP